MNHLKALSLSQLTTSELLSGSKNIVAITESLMATDPYISRQVGGLNGAITSLADIDNEERTNEHTQAIRTLDAEVDILLPLIEDDLKGTIKKAVFNPDSALSAEALLLLFNKRDRTKLIYGSYVDQGREINALFAELFAPEYATHLSIAGIEPMTSKLNSTYSQLQGLLNERLNQGNFETTQKEQKRVLRYRLDKLLSYLEANVHDNIDGFSVIETPVNELITDIMADYRARQTRKENSAQ